MHTPIHAGSADGLYLLVGGVMNIVGEILFVAGMLTGVLGFFMVVF
jgi:hypothetical protein